MFIKLVKGLVQRTSPGRKQNPWTLENRLKNLQSRKNQQSQYLMTGDRCVLYSGTSL
jgi:hypothetical protein